MLGGKTTTTTTKQQQNKNNNKNKNNNNNNHHHHHHHLCLGQTFWNNLSCTKNGHTICNLESKGGSQSLRLTENIFFKGAILLCSKYMYITV